MDLRFTGPEPTATERAAVDAVLGPPVSSWAGGPRDLAAEGRTALLGGHEARAHRDRLLPALHAIQDRFGWITPGALNYVCQRLTVPPAEAYGVASFYHMFSTTRQPAAVAHVCDDVACRIKGSEATCAELEKKLGPAGHAHGASTQTWRRSPCLGQCERGPAALVVRAGESPQLFTTPGTAEAVLAGLSGAAPVEDLKALLRSVPQAGQDGLRLIRRIGLVDPGSLEAYRKTGGYAGLKRAQELGPAGTIREVTDSKLVGRGGAAFPTGRKWDAVAKEAARPHYLVCNADESEPGTFKDRLLMEGDPFAVVEGMTIAGFAAGCERGYIYIRGEYPLAARRMQAAVDAARAAGLLGEKAGFDIEVRRGAGAYICGEETALINSIEGKRGEPRNKPPFPVQVGLFGKPTVVNNVETLANVPLILAGGAAAWAGLGTAGSAGVKLFCVSGHVARPGLYEVPFGKTLREVLALAGGATRGIRAILVGGAAGTFIGPDKLDTPLTFEGTRAVNASLGSGVIVVFDETTDLTDILARIAQFFRDESCGQCVPCRVGTVRQEELLARLRAKKPLGSTTDELALFSEIAQAMRDASICGLGQTAASAVESAAAAFGPTCLEGRR
ncbi:MAG: NAD(P)H-dependent oxidoreductase subunit E [Planctomycetia bacterium]|nr:NAD(P)H-dependent oxidoreductase subunit E [Planctomycetia bacterium]